MEAIMEKDIQDVVYTCDNCGKVIDADSCPQNVNSRHDDNNLLREAIFCDECKIKFIKLEKEINRRQ